MTPHREEGEPADPGVLSTARLLGALLGILIPILALGLYILSNAIAGVKAEVKSELSALQVSLARQFMSRDDVSLMVQSLDRRVADSERVHIDLRGQIGAMQKQIDDLQRQIDQKGSHP